MSHREPNHERAECRIAAPLGLADALDCASAFAEHASLGAGDAARLAVIVEELVANLFDHGALAEAGVATLSLERRADMIELRLADPCPPFDPRAAVRRDEHDERGGGVGIELVRAWAESLDYISGTGGNLLTLHIRLQH